MQNPETRANDGAGTQQEKDMRGLQAMERGLAWLEKVTAIVSQVEEKKIDVNTFHTEFDKLLDSGDPAKTLEDVHKVCENAAATLPLLAVHALKSRIYFDEHARRNPKRAD